MILRFGMKHQGVKLYKDYINQYPGVTLTYFTARSFEWGKLLKCHLKVKLEGNGQMGQRFVILKKWTSGAGLPPPWGNIHVHYHNIQRASLKPLGQSKPNLIYRRGSNVYINNSGHLTKMAACPYMVKPL